METRARCPAPRCDSSTPRAPRHIDIEFDESYNAHGTFVQRLSEEPRIPKPQGMQYVPETNPEVHYMLLGILLRPLRLPVEPPVVHGTGRRRALARSCSKSLGPSWAFDLQAAPPSVSGTGAPPLVSSTRCTHCRVRAGFLQVGLFTAFEA